MSVQQYRKNKDAFLECFEYLKGAVSEQAGFEVLCAMNSLINQSRDITNTKTFSDIGESI